MISVGIIGAGRIGRVHVQSITTRIPEAKVRMLADPYMNEATRDWALSLGVQRVTKDYHEVLDDPEIEAVLICSSTDTQAQISIEAILAGKHVFCEKPVDQDAEKILEVMDVLKRHPVAYQVGFNRRFDHNFRAVRRAVEEGRIGEPQIIRICSRDPEPPKPEYVKVSGGMFLDMTIHDFDMARFLAGCDATEVYASGACLIDPAIGEAGDIDTAVVTLTMENGARCVIDNSRQAVYGYDQRAEVFGSKGMVSSENDRPSTVSVSTASGVTGDVPLHFFLERYMDAYAEEVRSFLTSVEEGKEPAPGIEDGLKAVQMALAAKVSLREHRPVRMTELFQ